MHVYSISYYCKVATFIHIYKYNENVTLMHGGINLAAEGTFSALCVSLMPMIIFKSICHCVFFIFLMGTER